MFKGFKEFLMRGNVVDLAIAVVIGGAFAKVIDSVVTGVINPLVAVALGGKGTLAGSVCLGDKVAGLCPQAVTLNYAGIITALIVFIATALVVYFVFVVPMNKMREISDRRKAALEEAAEQAVSEEVALLTEIRDELRARAN